MLDLRSSKYWIVGAAAVLAVMLTGCGKQGDPAAYLDVSFSGVESRGVCQVELDLERMTIAALGKSESELENWEGLGEYLEMYDVLHSGIDVEVDVSEGLSNGDKVAVSINCGDEAEKYFKSVETTYTVEGLTEAIEVDPFAYLEITYSGISGDAAMHLENNAEDDILSRIRFDAEEMYHVSSGDKIEITASLAEQYSEEHGYLLSETSKTVTVPVLDHYITDTALITEEIIQGIVAQHVPDYTYESNEYWGYSVPEYYGSYFVNIPEGNWTVNELVVFLTYQTWIIGDETNVETKYIRLPYSNIVATPEGELLLEHEYVLDYEDRYFVDMETERAAVEANLECEWYDLEF